MKVRTVITTEVDLVAIYKLCVPIDKTKCAGAIRSFVEYQIMRMAGPDGGWLYPEEVLIANHLIENGLAVLPN